MKILEKIKNIFEKPQELSKTERIMLQNEKIATAPYPFCNSLVKNMVVTNWSYRGRIGSMEKGWVCGTRTGMRLMNTNSFQRGEDCLTKQRK